MVLPFTTPSSPSDPISSPPETPSDRIPSIINAPPFNSINSLSSYKPRFTRSVLQRTSKIQSLTASSLRTITARAPAGTPQIRGPRRSSRIQALTRAPPHHATSNLRTRTTQPKNDCANTVYVTTENSPEAIPQSSTLTEFKVILDSGATAHMFNNVAHFVT